MALVRQAGPERVRGELGAAHAEVALRRGFSPHRVGVEVPLEPRPRGGCRLQRPRVDDLVGRPPDLREVPDGRRLPGELDRLPGGQHLVHAASEEGADPPREVVDAHALVRLGPVELPVLVGDEAVERRERRIDQLGHRRRLRPGRARRRTRSAPRSGRPRARGRASRRGRPAARARLVRLEPAGRADAPAVARREPVEPPLRPRCREVVPGPLAEGEELLRHHRADGVRADVLRPGRAAAVAEEARQRRVRARQELAADDVHVRVAGHGRR